jgi:hypothetical protein
MAMAATMHFYEYVISYFQLALYIFALVIEVVAFAHCLVQRPDAFSAINTLPKGAWLALTGGSILITLIFLASSKDVTSLLGMITITIAAVYLLDVRPALRDAVDGHGPW